MSRTQNLDAERELLSAILRWPSVWEKVEGAVSEADFSIPGYRTIFAAMSGLAAAAKSVNTASVHAVINAGAHAEVMALGDINDLACYAAHPRSARHHAEAVRAAAMERALLAAIEECGDVAMGEGEYADRLERIAARFSEMTRRSVRQMPRSMSEIVGGRIDHYTALSAGKKQVNAWRTGIPSLDQRFTGGLRGGKVYVLAARPGLGKSSLSSHIALRLAGDGLPSLILTQEMPDEEVADRAIANRSRVEYALTQTGAFEAADWDGLAEGIEQLAAMPLHVDDQAGLTLSDIRAKARSVRGLKLLVVDYLQLCSGTARRGEANRNAEIEEISRGIKTLAKELDCAVLLLSQLNREVEKRNDKRPTLADLRDSGSIEQDADAVIFLWPVRDFENGARRLVGCHVAKNRGGALGEFGLDFEPRFHRWGESDQDIRTQPQTAVARGRSRAFDE